jgi:hypothetical protein
MPDELTVDQTVSRCGTRIARGFRRLPYALSVVLMGCQRPGPATTAGPLAPSTTRPTTQVVDSTYTPLSFDAFGNYDDNEILRPNWDVPKSERQYDRRRVVIVGEMLVVDPRQDVVDSFALCDPKDVKKQWPPPKQVVVYPPPGTKVPNRDRWIIRAYGTFEVGLHVDPELDGGDPLYRLRPQRFELLRHAE